MWGFPDLAGQAVPPHSTTLGLGGAPQGAPQQRDTPRLPDGALEGRLSPQDLAYQSERQGGGRTPRQLPGQLLGQLPGQLPHRAAEQRKKGSWQPPRHQAPEAPDPSPGQLPEHLPQGFIAMEDGPSAPSMPPSCSGLQHQP